MDPRPALIAALILPAAVHASDLADVLTGAGAAHGAEPWTVEVEPCQVVLTRATALDGDASMTWRVAAALDQIDFTDAKVAPSGDGGQVRITAPWLGGAESTGARADDALWQAFTAELEARADAAQGLDTEDRALAFQSTYQLLADAAKRGQFGVAAQRNTLHVSVVDRPGAAPRLVHFWVHYPFVLDVDGGQADRVIDALDSWRAQTCAGG